MTNSECDIEKPFVHISTFTRLKQAYQMSVMTKTAKGEESDFSAAVRESNNRRAHELACSTYFYWGSIIDSSNVDILLDSTKQCLLIDTPPTLLDGRERARLILAVKEDTIKYYSIKCAANELIVSGSARKLNKFIAEEGLQPVQRQYIWREDQLSSPSACQQYTFDSMYSFGKVERRNIVFPSKKAIGVVSVVASDLKPEERNVMLNDLASYKNFGCINTQRLWGSTVSSTQIALLLEDFAVDSLSNYVMQEARNNYELLQFAQQMATAIDFFERFKFIHKKLSIDVCLLSANRTLKVVVFGLSTGVVPKRIYLDDVERCRWLPWECLTGNEGAEPEPYDEKAVIWTLATIIWSMFHRAAIPLENETAQEIRNREFRKQFAFDIVAELLPVGVLELLQSCWMERSKRPSTRDVLKTIKKLQQQL